MKARAVPRVCRTAYLSHCHIGEVASFPAAGSLFAICNYPLAIPRGTDSSKNDHLAYTKIPMIVHLAEGTAPLTR